MDLVSHALIGAASAALIARPAETRVAAFAAAVAGLLPDADALIRSEADALLYLEYHRHFSHSLIFIPIGALLVATLLWPLLRRSCAYARLYCFCLLGIALAGFMDACTSYGTHLLWPFTDRRVAWNVIAVFDPLFTLLVGVPVLLGVLRSRPRVASLGLVLGAAYLGLAAFQHQRAATLLRTFVAERSLPAARILVKPTLGNIILWRGVVATDERIHVAAVRPGLFGEDKIYPGETVDRFGSDALTSLPPGSRLRTDLERFSFFSDELLTRPNEQGRVGDARYAMLPDSLRPMWSVRFDPAKPDRAVELVVDRQMTGEERKRFMAMLVGGP